MTVADLDVPSAADAAPRALAAPTGAPSAEMTPPRGTRTVRRSARTGRWMRTFHVYTSMISMLLVAFFALTGLTLNHPTWTLGSTTTTVDTGTVPAGAIVGSDVDELTISEYVRDEFGVTGHVVDHGVQGDSGYIDYAGPGYSASVTFSLTDGTLTTTVTQGDLLAIIGDVHKGRDTDGSWSWVIDAAAVLLLVVTVTGLGIQLLQRKRRRSALLTAGALSAITLLLLWVAMR